MNNALTDTFLFESSLPINGFSEKSVFEAKVVFDKYVERGVIVESCFNDKRWQFCDEYENVGIVFQFDEIAFKHFYEPVLGITSTRCISYLKSYIITILGRNVLKSLQNIVNDIKRLFSNDFRKTTAFKIKLTLPFHVEEFLEMLPCIDESAREELIYLINNISDYLYGRAHHKRTLASFESYFLFDALLQEYWSSQLTTKDRMFYYPLYLWWNITAIIPLRPREFILTPRSCLSQQSKQWYLTLRRNQLKGSNRKINYNIESDYEEVNYMIPSKLAECINKYIQATRDYEENQTGTLFRVEPHYKMFEQKKHKKSRYYTYINLSYSLRRFYSKILHKQFGMNLVLPSNVTLQNLKTYEIEYIHLGDTRHIAMINILAEGGTPTIAMILAGHNDITISSHYYANITNLIECKTYMKYRKSIAGTENFLIGSNYYTPGLSNDEYVDLEDGGKCYSKAFIKGDFIDCKNSSGKNGELGFCPECLYYRNGNMNYFLSDDSIYKSQIEKDCKLLSAAISKIRKGMGYEEDIYEAFLRLENSSLNYEKYFNQKLQQKPYFK